uniref:Uncharacterized protein n=1 Tax=Solanum tuberosum TaxID=4113 RepID=M1D8M4_SOLTU
MDPLFHPLLIRQTSTSESKRRKTDRAGSSQGVVDADDEGWEDEKGKNILPTQSQPPLTGGTHGHHPRTVDGLTVHPAGQVTDRSSCPWIDAPKAQLQSRLMVDQHGPSIDPRFRFSASRSRLDRFPIFSSAASVVQVGILIDPSATIRGSAVSWPSVESVGMFLWLTRLHKVSSASHAFSSLGRDKHGFWFLLFFTANI